MTVTILDGVPYIAGKPYPWAAAVTVDDVDVEPHPFRIRRFVLTFENGWSVSVLYGDATYSSNYDAWFLDGEFEEEPEHVEVAVLDPDGSMLADPVTLNDVLLLVLIATTSTHPSSARAGTILLDP